MRRDRRELEQVREEQDRMAVAGLQMSRMRSPGPAGGHLGGFQYLTLAIGCMIGVGWITVVGEWLSRAGPAGTVAGFIIGGIVMAGVAACYAELSAMMPIDGGDVVFAEQVFGGKVAFVVGWFLILRAASVAAFEAISFVWVATILAPGLGAWRLYSLFGEPITVQGLGLGSFIVGFIYLVNRASTGASARVQDLITVLKLVIIAVFVGTALTLWNPGALLQGPARAGADPVIGSLWIAATCPFWLGGFQVISQAAGDRKAGTSLQLVGSITAGSVFIGILFYVGVALAVALAGPISQTVQAPLPAARAAAYVFHSSMGSGAVLIAGLFGITATLNAMIVSGSRLALALGRLGFLPRPFAGLDRRGVPGVALNLITALSFLGVLAGRGALLPVVDTAAVALIVSYVLVCAAVLRLRLRQPEAERPFRMPGGLASIVATLSGVVAMALFIILEPAFETRTVPLQWLLLAGWGLIGLGIWLVRVRARPA